MGDSDGDGKRAEAMRKKEEGNKLYVAGSYEEALRCYSEAIELEPENAIYYSNRSACHGALGDWVRAEEDAKTCVRKDETFIKGYFRLSTAQLEQQKFEDATNTLNAGLKIDANNGELKKQKRIVNAKKSSAAVAARRAASGGAQASSAARKQRGGGAGSGARGSGGRGGGGGVDESAQKDLAELQEQLQSSTRDLQRATMQLNGLEREVQRNRLTRREIDKLPSSVPLYLGMGKAFISMDQGAVDEHLSQTENATNKRISDLRARQQFLERHVTSLQGNFNEMMQEFMRNQQRT